MKEINHYRVLGVSREGTQEQIKSAYRREALHWHPDRNPGDREAEKRFKAAREAYEVLRDPEKRQAHDMDLVGLGGEAAFAGFGRRQGRGRRCGGGRGRRCGGRFGAGRRRWASAVSDLDDVVLVDVSLGPIEAVLGCTRGISMDSASGKRMLEIRLPPGLADGDVVRLARLGGDVWLRVNIAPMI